MTVLAGDTAYGPATASHLGASSSALRDLAALVTSVPGRHHQAPLHVQLALVDHGGFLTLQLYSFNVLPLVSPSHPALPQEGSAPVGSELEFAFGSPVGSTAAQPFTLAVIVNHSVTTQVLRAMAAIAALLGRQTMRRDHPDADSGELEGLAAASDDRAMRDVDAAVASSGWRDAARALGVRAEAAGFPLSVSLGSPALNREAIAARTPAMRRIYDELPPVRTAVDRAVALLSQGLATRGGGSPAMARFARNILDTSATRKFLAHLARDAFVCGNGYLSFGNLADEDVQLILPERAELLDAETVRENRPNGTTVLHRKVVHIRGMEQAGGAYGLSQLEPFLMLQMQREMRFDVLNAKVPPGLTTAPMVLRMTQEARDYLAKSDAEIERVLGGALTGSGLEQRHLYFPGRSAMGSNMDVVARAIVIA